MPNRPGDIKLPPKTSHSHLEAPMASPRLALYDGEVPPALSPLDAFALQSRLLAEQLDSAKNNGKRASRLPPLTVSKSLGQSRPGYFRSPTGTSFMRPIPTLTSPADSDEGREHKSPRFAPELEYPSFRPKSEYTRFSGTPDPQAQGFQGTENNKGKNEEVPKPKDAPPSQVEPEQTQAQRPVGRERGNSRDAENGSDKRFNDARSQAGASPAFAARAGLQQRPPPNSFFNNQRVHSPEPMSSFHDDADARNGLDATPKDRFGKNHELSPQRGASTESASSAGYSARSLAPPSPPRARKSPSMRSLREDHSDDDVGTPNVGPGFPKSRKLSTASSGGFSMPRSPMSPFVSHQSRSHSPSVSSEVSGSTSHHLRKPTFNFSRPLSARPSLDSIRPSLDANRPPTDMRRPSGDIQMTPSSSSSNNPFGNATRPGNMQPPPDANNGNNNNNRSPHMLPRTFAEVARRPPDASRPQEPQPHHINPAGPGNPAFPPGDLNARQGTSRPHVHTDSVVRGVGGGPQNSPSPLTEMSRSFMDPARQLMYPPSRQTSQDSTSPVSSNNMPISASFTSESCYSSASDAPNTTSYIYSKYSLPRGRILSRESMILQDLELPHFEWEQQPFANVPVSDTESNPRSPSAESPSNSNQGDGQKPDSAPVLTKPTELKPPDEQNTTKERVLHSSHSTRTTTTVSDMTDEEHLQKGIDCHEKGSLGEATYHLRLAAKMNNPTGMLLYALACRHGWGMRPNPQEGVRWLRKAADCASLEMAENDDAHKENERGSAAERKARKAQFALSIYELGVSNLNGWGTDQDKALALRCFEIAGNWGDPDALTEAGFCYSQGIGCKKDLKKAAKFYRMAEARGVSMVGNSWIHKPKYQDDDEEGSRSRSMASTPDKKSRSRSRARTLFSRRRAPDMD